MFVVSMNRCVFLKTKKGKWKPKIKAISLCLISSENVFLIVPSKESNTKIFGNWDFWYVFCFSLFIYCKEVIPCKSWRFVKRAPRYESNDAMKK